MMMLEQQSRLPTKLLDESIQSSRRLVQVDAILHDERQRIRLADLLSREVNAINNLDEVISSRLKLVTVDQTLTNLWAALLEDEGNVSNTTFLQTTENIEALREDLRSISALGKHDAMQQVAKYAAHGEKRGFYRSLFDYDKRKNPDRKPLTTTELSIAFHIYGKQEVDAITSIMEEAVNDPVFLLYHLIKTDSVPELENLDLVVHDITQFSETCAIAEVVREKTKDLSEEDKQAVLVQKIATHIGYNSASNINPDLIIEHLDGRVDDAYKSTVMVGLIGLIGELEAEASSSRKSRKGLVKLLGLLTIVVAGATFCLRPLINEQRQDNVNPTPTPKPLATSTIPEATVAPTETISGTPTQSALRRVDTPTPLPTSTQMATATNFPEDSNEPDNLPTVIPTIEEITSTPTPTNVNEIPTATNNSSDETSEEFTATATTQATVESQVVVVTQTPNLDSPDIFLTPQPLPTFQQPAATLPLPTSTAVSNINETFPQEEQPAGLRIGIQNRLRQYIDTTGDILRVLRNTSGDLIAELANGLSPNERERLTNEVQNNFDSEEEPTSNEMRQWLASRFIFSLIAVLIRRQVKRVAINTTYMVKDELDLKSEQNSLAHRVIAQLSEIKRGHKFLWDIARSFLSSPIFMFGYSALELSKTLQIRRRLEDHQAYEDDADDEPEDIEDGSDPRVLLLSKLLGRSVEDIEIEILQANTAVFIARDDNTILSTNSKLSRETLLEVISPYGFIKKRIRYWTAKEGNENFLKDVESRLATFGKRQNVYAKFYNGVSRVTHGIKMPVYKGVNLGTWLVETSAKYLKINLEDRQLGIDPSRFEWEAPYTIITDIESWAKQHANSINGLKQKSERLTNMPEHSNKVRLGRVLLGSELVGMKIKDPGLLTIEGKSKRDKKFTNVKSKLV